MSILNALFKFKKAKEQQRVFQEQAAHELFLADSERIEGQRAENQLTDQLFGAIASQKVAVVANGIDLSSNLAKNITRLTIRRGEREVRKIKLDTVQAVQARRRRSRGLLQQGRFARLAGIVEGVSEIQSTISRVKTRG